MGNTCANLSLQIDWLCNVWFEQKQLIQYTVMLASQFPVKEIKFGAYVIWARRDVYRVISAMTQELGLYEDIPFRTGQFFFNIVIFDEPLADISEKISENLTNDSLKNTISNILQCLQCMQCISSIVFW